MAYVTLGLTKLYKAHMRTYTHTFQKLSIKPNINLYTSTQHILYDYYEQIFLHFYFYLTS